MATASCCDTCSSSRSSSSGKSVSSGFATLSVPWRNRAVWSGTQHTDRSPSAAMTPEECSSSALMSAHRNTIVSPLIERDPGRRLRAPEQRAVFDDAVAIGKHERMPAQLPLALVPERDARIMVRDRLAQQLRDHPSRSARSSSDATALVTSSSSRARSRSAAADLADGSQTLDVGRVLHRERKQPGDSLHERDRPVRVGDRLPGPERQRAEPRPRAS